MTERLAADGKVLLLRADAGPAIGMGHVLRCLALAQEWRSQGGRAIFASAALPDALVSRLIGEGFALERTAVEVGSRKDQEATVASAEHVGADWVVLDGYRFQANFVSALTGAGRRVLYLDDEGRLDDHSPSVVLNQNLNATEALYRSRSPDVRLLLGTRYALLRQEFRRERRRRVRSRSAVRRILVTLGGADPGKFTPVVVEALQESEVEAEIVVIVGAADPLREKVAAGTDSRPGRVTVRVDESRIAEWMVWADLAIAAAGTTTWELACMGVPSLLFVVAGNQRAVAEAVAAAGAARMTTRATLRQDLREALADVEWRRASSEIGRRLVDGFGAERVVASILDWPLVVRPAARTDCHIVWEWANDAVVRAASFSSGFIPWEAHRRWFTSFLRDERNIFFIAEDREGRPIGQIRFAGDGETAVVSVSLAPTSRGRGLGGILIAVGSREAFAVSGIRCIRAFVKPENERSLRAFEGAGYRRMGLGSHRERDAWELVLERGR